MKKSIASSVLAFSLLGLSQTTFACENHFGGAMGRYGFAGGMPQHTGFAPIEPVFKLKHTPLAKVVLGEDHAIKVEYKRPFTSDEVTLELTSSDGVQLQDQTLQLEEVEGTVDVRFTLNKPGLSSIAMKVTGEHKGKTVSRSSVVYISPKKTKPAEQVSQR